jgi:hypothetical protein
MIHVAVCSICLKTKKENLMLFGKNICEDCEALLTQSSIEDISYDLYVDKIKDILMVSSKRE